MDTPNLAAALVAAHAELSNPPMDSENPHFRSRFASLLSCEQTIRPVLQRHGIAAVQKLGGGDGLVTVETVLVHISGEQMSCGVAATAPDRAGPQAYGSSVTYLRRYSLLAALGLVGDPDDDAEAAEPPRKQDKPQGDDIVLRIRDLAEECFGDEWIAKLGKFCSENGFPAKVADQNNEQRATVVRALESLRRA